MTDFWIEDVPVWKRLVVIAPAVIVGLSAVSVSVGWLFLIGPWCGLC